MCFFALLTNLAFSRMERPCGQHAVGAVTTWDCHLITLGLSWHAEGAVAPVWLSGDKAKWVPCCQGPRGPNDGAMIPWSSQADGPDCLVVKGLFLDQTCNSYSLTETKMEGWLSWSL